MSLSKHLLIKKEDGGKVIFSGSLDPREALKAIELKINEEEAKSMDCRKDFHLLKKEDGAGDGHHLSGQGALARKRPPMGHAAPQSLWNW